MTVNRGLFVRNLEDVGTSPTEARLALAGMLAEDAPGVPRPGVLFQRHNALVTGRPNMAYRVEPCQIVVTRDEGEGPYLVSVNGTTDVPTGASPSTGSRIDLIYVIQRDPDKGDADNDAVVAVQQGTTATNPTAPYSALPAGAYVLAEAHVNAGTTATDGPGVTIEQKWQHTTTRGAPIPVRNQAEADAITKYPGLSLQRLDLTGAPCMTWSGVAWTGTFTKPFAHAGLTSGFVKAPWIDGATPTRIPVPAQVLRGGVASVNGGLVVPMTGLYRITGKYYVSGGNQTLCTGDIWKNGTTTVGVNQGFWKEDFNDYHGHASVVYPLEAGDSLELRCTAKDWSVWGTNGYNGVFMEVEWFGPSEPWQ